MFQTFDSLQISSKQAFMVATGGEPRVPPWRTLSGAQRVGVGLLQAQRALVRQRVAVIVFDQRCQVREGHLAVQKYQVILSKHIADEFST